MEIRNINVLLVDKINYFCHSISVYGVVLYEILLLS